MPRDLISYVGMATAVAVLGTLAGTLTFRATGRRTSTSGVALSVMTLFFLALTQLPFPDPATMICPVPYTAPRLEPFRFARRALDLLMAPEVLHRRLLDTGVLSAIMNLVICIAIGAALARWTRRGMGFAVVWAATLSMSVELTQLSAFWGLFPCPWRLFDVDDLILNIAGVAIGFWAVRRWLPVRP